MSAFARLCRRENDDSECGVPSGRRTASRGAPVQVCVACVALPSFQDRYHYSDVCARGDEAPLPPCPATPLATGDGGLSSDGSSSTYDPTATSARFYQPKKRTPLRPSPDGASAHRPPCPSSGAEKLPALSPRLVRRASGDGDARLASPLRTHAHAAGADRGKGPTAAAPPTHPLEALQVNRPSVKSVGADQTEGEEGPTGPSATGVATACGSGVSAAGQRVRTPSAGGAHKATAQLERRGDSASYKRLPAPRRPLASLGAAAEFVHGCKTPEKR
ncbi:hypothetical protein STCU_10235 [Strigomonas culicis]|uniref:Uncharacterized protein n=1 Tax=Strigomonas culicis TaxID=28005 RepID=S9TIY9_9TRYP|nr:hypothetical protein STCU_10235 [Strigomonas culicis]|eukprot:EPY18037.1 hypothetical protein STCU_10235 [Strigomonas culicis]